MKCNSMSAKYADKIWLTCMFVSLSEDHLVSCNSGEPLLWNRRSVVRAHPTVPAAKPMLCRSTPKPARQFRNRLTATVLPSLLVPRRSLTIRRSTVWGRGNHVCCPICEFPIRFDARNADLGFGAADGGPGLYPRAAGRLQRRCVSSLQRRYP